ncbi:MAG: ElyC/SanA/YdcF family protein [Candidatus Paceibacterota bacterium]
MTRRRFFAAGLLLLIGFMAVWFGRDSVLPPLAGWLDVGETPQPVTAVLPLPGDEHTRPFVAAAWVRTELAEAMLINQNEASPDVEDGVAPPTHEIIRGVAEVRELDSSQIEMLDGASTSTADDLDQLDAYMNEHPDATVAVVTSEFHTRRTRWTIRHRYPDWSDRIVMVAAPNPGFETPRWWWTDTGRRLIVSEYLKLGYYHLRYGNGRWVVGAAVVVVVALLAVRRRRSSSERRVASGEK